MINKNEIQAGEESTNIQHSRNVTVTNTQNYGVSYTDVKEIALDVFKNNFYQLSEEASNLALKRVEIFIEKVIEKLKSEKTSLLDSFKEPDMQYVIYNSQIAYARSGDENLSDVLIDLLVKRASITERSLKQIVLNESLEVAPKLTNNQLNLLSLLFLFKNAINPNMKSLEFLDYYIKIFVSPFINGLSVKDIDFWHLEYAGCGKVEGGKAQLDSIFLNKYSILFSKGFTLEQVEEKNVNKIEIKDVLIPCLHDHTKYQFDRTKKEELTEKFGESNVSELLELYEDTLMTDIEVEKFLKEFNKDLGLLIELWNSSHMKNMSLTSVGIALGNANIRRKTGRDIDISIWIKE